MSADLQSMPPLPEWLATHGPEIAEAIEFCRCLLDPAPDKLNAAGAEINAKAANMGFLLADAEAYLVAEKARSLKNLEEDVGPTAAKVSMENDTKDLRRLRDQLKVAVRSLRSLSISVCSVRKSQGAQR